MSEQAPDKIWAFYAPHIAEDENGATIIAHETAQYGSESYTRTDAILSDPHTAALAARPDIYGSHLCVALRQEGYLVPYEIMAKAMQSAALAAIKEANDA